MKVDLNIFKIYLKMSPFFLEFVIPKTYVKYIFPIHWHELVENVSLFQNLCVFVIYFIYYTFEAYTKLGVQLTRKMSCHLLAPHSSDRSSESQEPRAKSQESIFIFVWNLELLILIV